MGMITLELNNIYIYIEREREKKMMDMITIDDNY